MPKDVNYRSYHRYVMNERERIQWNHQNPELREPFREMISDFACREAMDRGVECYLVIDGETEEVVAQGEANPFRE